MENNNVDVNPAVTEALNEAAAPAAAVETNAEQKTTMPWWKKGAIGIGLIGLGAAAVFGYKYFTTGDAGEAAAETAELFIR